MTQQTRAALKLKFEQGDRPQGSDYEDLIDSFVNTQDATAQTLNSTLVVPKLGAASVTANMVSAQSVVVSGALAVTVDAVTVSAQHVNGSAANFGTVSAQNMQASAATLGSLTVVGRASAAEYVTFSIDTSVAAVSTTQASGKTLGAKQVHFVQSVASGANDSVVLLGAYPGLYQQVWNVTSQSGRIYPPSGASINSAADNAAYDMHPKSCTHITHMTSTRIMAARSSM